MFVELGNGVQEGQPLYLIETASTNLTVRSPFSGQVAAINVSPGTSVQPGKIPPLRSGQRFNRKWLLASVPES